MPDNFLEPAENVYLFTCKNPKLYKKACKVLAGIIGPRKVRHNPEEEEERGLDFVYETKEGLVMEFGMGTKYYEAAFRISEILKGEFKTPWKFDLLDKEAAVKKYKIRTDDGKA